MDDESSEKLASRIGDVTTELHDAAVLIHVSGEIDISNVDELQKQLSAAIDRATKLLVVDLEKVSFIDSSGIGALVGCQQRSSGAAQQFRLVVTNSQVLRLLELLGLEGVFTVYADLSSALQDV